MAKHHEAKDAAKPITRIASPTSDIKWILAMLLSLVVPAFLTLSTIRHHPGSARPDSSPHGYTVSLLLFLIPVVNMYWWRYLHPGGPHHRRALFWASGTIAALGFLLDFAFGYSFFVYPNELATLGIRLPAWSFADGRWIPNYLPIEEFGFYIFGAWFVLGVYVWADAMWLKDYHPDDFAALAHRKAKLIDVHWRSVGLVIALIALGIVAKKLGSSPEGFPGYYVFIMCIGFAPTVLLLNGLKDFVNWRAFAFAYGNLLLISLMWEATLAVPYGWWNYKEDQMLGIVVMAWSNLPIEAVLLWMVIAWDCIIAFELFRVVLHMDKPIAEAMLGIRAGKSMPAREPASSA